jgi:hypothetical protein
MAHINIPIIENCRPSPYTLNMKNFVACAACISYFQSISYRAMTSVVMYPVEPKIRSRIVSLGQSRKPILAP